MNLFRIYEHVGEDGYPPEWHAEIKHLVREQAGNRCVRCGHPYRVGEHGSGEWSPCDAGCSHGLGDFRAGPSGIIEARWRILTVHHLNGVKADCRWHNLIAACQRCHLNVQRRVVMDRPWPWPHNDWFKPYAAAYYAATILGEELTRDETEDRLEELLALGAADAAVERMPL